MADESDSSPALSPDVVAGHRAASVIPNVARALLGLVEDRGLSPGRLCRGLGFTYEDLLAHDILLSYHQTRDLILRAQRALRDPALGIAAGARQTPVSWGVAGLAMLTCETLGEAIYYGITHQSDAGAMVEHLLEESGREIVVELRPRQFDLQIESFLVDESMSSALAICRYLVGPDFKPLRVDLAQPRPESDEVYRRFFRCPVRFDAGCNLMTLEAHWLGARLPGYDRITCNLLQNQLNRILTQPIGRHDLVESLTNRMRIDIESPSRQKDLAQWINVSDRTLRRRLGDRNTTFRTLRDSTRYERALDLLKHSDLTVAQVAEAVGYSDARAFRRAFKRWSGHLPAEVRESFRETVR